MIVDGKRALAHIERVTNIRPIEGADNIEQCNVLGWNLIAKKGEFHENDLAVYIEIDSRCPETEQFEFLRAKGFKVKTMKLGKFGVISQGLALPVSEFKEIVNAIEGTDVTNILGITYAVAEDNARKNGDPDAKYKSMAARHQNIFKKKWARWMMRRQFGRKIMFFFFGKKKDKPRGFPTHFEFVHKTDEDRIESCPWLLEDKQDWVASEKLDGTSSTYILERKGKNKFEFYVCSRNVRMQSENQKCYHDINIYWNNAFKYNIEQYLKDFLNEHKELKYVAIQGESVGHVQGNPLKLNEDDLYIFNLIDSSNGRWDSRDGKKLIESWHMKWVPLLGVCKFPDTMEEMKTLATGKSQVNSNVLREGIVYRTLNGKQSVKNVSNEYLLKHNL